INGAARSRLIRASAISPQNHRAVRIPEKKYALTDSRFCRLIGETVLLQHGQCLAIAERHSQLRALAEIDCRFDFSSQSLLRGLDRDADLLGSNKQTHACR